MIALVSNIEIFNSSSRCVVDACLFNSYIKDPKVS
jgi:hypothetical protein